MEGGPLLVRVSGVISCEDDRKKENRGRTKRPTFQRCGKEARKITQISFEKGEYFSMTGRGEAEGVIKLEGNITEHPSKVMSPPNKRTDPDITWKAKMREIAKNKKKIDHSKNISCSKKKRSAGRTQEECLPEGGKSPDNNGKWAEGGGDAKRWTSP